MSTLIENPIVLLILFLWTIPWKIYSLWTAAKKGHKVWFVAIIILNTFGLLEIVYIFFVAKKTLADVKRTLLHTFSSTK